MPIFTVYEFMKRGWLLICSILFALSLFGQDTKLSHPFMWKSFNNPGYSGFDGLMQVNLGFRRSFWSNPLKLATYFVSFDYPFSNRRSFGLGGVSLFYQRDQENSLMYVTNMFGAAIASRVQVTRSTVLQFGLQPMVYRKSVDPSRMTLGDQFDPYYGQILDVSPSLLELYADKLWMFDVAAGIYGQTDFNIAWHGVASLEYGFSVYHIIESTQSFLSAHGSKSSEENLLKRRYSGYLAYLHPLAFGNRINTVLSPYLMLDYQSTMRNVQFGLSWEEGRMGMIGMGLKADQYEGLKVGTFLVHLGVYPGGGREKGWKIAYTFETPTDQGTMYKNTSHSLSLHWYMTRNPQRCVQRFDHSPNNRKFLKNNRNRTFRKGKTFRL